MLAEPEPEREYWYVGDRDYDGNPLLVCAPAKDFSHHVPFFIREKRPDGTWRVLSSEEMAEVLK